MATLHETVKAMIVSAIPAAFGDRVYDANDISDRDGGGWQWASDTGLVVDGLTLIPHAKLRWGNSNAIQTEHPALGAERESLEVYLYDDAGYATIDAAIPALKTALHNVIIDSADDRATAKALYTFASNELPTGAEEYQGRPMKFVRFQIIHIR